MGSKHSSDIEGRKGLAGAKPANWLPSNQLRLGTRQQVPWVRVKLTDRSRTLAPRHNGWSEASPFWWGHRGSGRWEAPMVSGAQLIPSLRCSAQGSTCFLQCPLILLAEEPPSALSGWVHIDSELGQV